MKRIPRKLSLLCNHRCFIYAVRIISWITIALYVYLAASNLEYYSEYSYTSIILVFAAFGTDYKVNYCKTSFFRRFCEVFLHFCLVMLLVFAMYALATH